MKKRIAVVTGANRGLGLGTATELVKRDYHVILTARNVVEGALRAKEIGAEFMPLDVNDESALIQFTKDVLERHGCVDVLVNNAGILLGGRDTQSVKDCIATNTLAPLILIEAFLPKMIEQNFGRIVNVSSLLGQLKEMNAGYIPYRVSKVGLNALTRIFASEAKGKNVLINSIDPGWVKTEMGGPGAEREIDQGVASIIWGATLPGNGPTGGFFRDGHALSW